MADSILKPSSGNDLVLQDEGGSDALTVDASGNIEINAMDIRMITSGKGIDFSGIGTAAEILDDYEEGTWTPRLYQSGANEVTSPDNAIGYYRAIGDMVYIWGYFSKNTSPTNAEGFWEIRNVPFLITAGVTGGYPVLHAGYCAVNTATASISDAGDISRWQGNSSGHFTLYGVYQQTSWTSGQIEFGFYGAYLKA